MSVFMAAIRNAPEPQAGSSRLKLGSTSWSRFLQTGASRSIKRSASESYCRTLTPLGGLRRTASAN